MNNLEGTPFWKDTSMYSQKHGKKQLSIGMSFTNWFTHMFDDLLEPSHLLCGLQPIDLGIWKNVCAMAQGLDHQKEIKFGTL